MGGLILVLICVLVPTICLADCPGGVDWVEYKTTCLLFSRSTRNWLDAENDCKRYDTHGSLATIDTVQKMSFVTNILEVLNYLGHGPHWIGANDYVIEGQFRWVKTDKAVNFFRWGDGEPDDIDSTQKDCVMIQNYNGTYLWNDDDCFRHRYWYICETPRVSADNGPVIG